jgi:uncharacterized repeat protein (TIGR01451 family)
VGSQVLTQIPNAAVLGAGQTLTVHITGVTSAADTSPATFQGTLSNTATVNSGSRLDRVQTAQAGILILAPDVDVSQAADSGSISAGGTAGFTITVTNEGPGDARGLTLTDLLPADLGSGINWQIDGSAGTPWAFLISGAVGSQVLSLAGANVTLAAGARLTVHVTGFTSAADADPATFQGTLANAVTVAASNESTTEQNEQASATVTVQAPDVDVTLGVDKATVNAGETAGFTLTVRNEGQGLGTGVTLTALLPDGFGHDVNWQVDGSTGTPSAFLISGAVGSQVLSLAGANITLAAGVHLTVHVTGLTSTADAASTGLTGTLPITAKVNAGNEIAAEQNDQAGATITVASQSRSPLAKGQTATIGFWHNKNGQAVIANFNGGPTATALGNWLAANFGNLFGRLAGKTNAQVANSYQAAFGNAGGVQGNTYAQSFAVALAVYTTTYSLGGASTAANPATAKFGFQITAAGAGAATYNVGTSGAGAGVPDGTSLTVLQILQIANNYFNPSTGLFYKGDSTTTSALNNLLNGINQAGDIPGA